MAVLGYDTFGSGPTKVIALHGWFGDEKTFAPLARGLDPDEIHWVSPAWRGYGVSRDIAGAYTMDEVAGDVLALADALGWKRFNLVGHSMGGKAVLRVLARAPERVEKVIGITPVPASGVPLDAETREVFKSAWSNLEAARGIVSHSLGGRLPRRYMDEIAAYPRKVAREEAFCAYLSAFADGDFSADLAGLSIPVKIIVGEHDGAITPDFMRATTLQHLPHADLEILPNAGHYPMDETPLALAASIAVFLKR